MARRQSKKTKIARQEAPESKPPMASNPAAASPTPTSLRRGLAFLLAAFAFLLYFNTLHYSYALDDYSLIKENTMTRRGIAALEAIMTTPYRAGYLNEGNQLYRPLSKMIFALEWQFFPDNPSAGHWVNVLIYTLTGVLVFYFLNLYLEGNLIAAFLAASLFIAHPLHTEVVANIKSLDEILSFLFFLTASLFTLQYLHRNSVLYLLPAAAAFFCALLSKESAITFVAVIPVMIWFSPRSSPRKNVTATVLMAIIACGYLLIRLNVLGSADSEPASVLDNVLSGLDLQRHIATAVFLMGMYLKLLVFPHPLVSDYSFHQIPIIDFTNWRFLTSLTAYIALVVYAIRRMKTRDPVSFGILYFLITASIVSNIFRVIGTSFGERLMFAPSFGFCLIAGVLCSKMIRTSNDAGDTSRTPEFFRNNSYTWIAVLAVLALYSIKTITRDLDWRDSLTLYQADVKNAPLSARAHYNLGDYLSEDEFIKTLGDNHALLASSLDTALAELSTAIRIYPQYADAFDQTGKIYYLKEDFQTAGEYYNKALALNPHSPLYLNNYGTVLMRTSRLADAKEKFEEAIRLNPAYAHAYNNLGSVYAQWGQQAVAKQDAAAKADNYKSAALNFRKAIESDPEYATPYSNIGMLFRDLGDDASAESYFENYRRLTRSQ